MTIELVPSVFEVRLPVFFGNFDGQFLDKIAKLLSLLRRDVSLIGSKFNPNGVLLSADDVPACDKRFAIAATLVDLNMRDLTHTT